VRDGVLSREQVQADQNNTHHLLKLGDPSDESNGRNPSIVIIAEGMREGAPFKDGEGYLAHTLRLEAAKASPQFWASGLPREVTLGGRKFYRAELNGGEVGNTVPILYYAAMERAGVLTESRWLVLHTEVDPPADAVIAHYHDALVALVREPDPARRLVRGQGDFGSAEDSEPAANPLFTYCRLTDLGRASIGH